MYTGVQWTGSQMELDNQFLFDAQGDYASRQAEVLEIPQIWRALLMRRCCLTAAIQSPRRPCVSRDREWRFLH
jgi:hypothetical protein